MNGLTEEQARKKVCPELRPEIIVGPVNDLPRVDTVWEYPKCLASGCMAWRHLPLRDGSPMQGYCGKFGRGPQ